MAFMFVRSIVIIALLSLICSCGVKKPPLPPLKKDSQKEETKK